MGSIRRTSHNVRNLGAGVGRPREVGVVEGVLSAVVATDVTFAAQAASPAREAVQVGMLLDERLAWNGRFAGIGEAHGQWRQLPVEAESGCCVLGGLGFGRLRVGGNVEGVALCAEHALSRFVVRYEVFVRNRPRARGATGGVVHKPRRVLSQEHVGVDEGPAAQATRDH